MKRGKKIRTPAERLVVEGIAGVTRLDGRPNRRKHSSAEREIIRRRRFTVGLGTVHLLSVESRNHGTGKRHEKLATVGLLTGSRSFDPARKIARAITEALDPTRAPSKVRTLADMDTEERAKLEREYRASIKPAERKELK